MIMTPVVYVPPKRDSYNGMKEQGGCEVSSEEGEPKGGDPCGEHGPEIYFLGLTRSAMLEKTTRETA